MKQPIIDILICVYLFISYFLLTMLTTSPNVSSDQSVAYDATAAAAVHAEVLAMLDDPSVYSILNIGSVAFMSGPSTAATMNSNLEGDIAAAIALGKTNFVVIGGGNFSDGKEGTTFTGSKWIQAAHTTYASHSKYGKLSFHALSCVPHSTDDMVAVWMEDSGNDRTKTYIVADSATARQECLAEYGSKADKVYLNEGSVGCLHEAYTLYVKNPTMFNTKVKINNCSWLIATVFPKMISDTNDYDDVKLKKLHTRLMTL